jgi:hypothetical protein
VGAAGGAGVVGFIHRLGGLQQQAAQQGTQQGVSTLVA